MEPFPKTSKQSNTPSLPTWLEGPGLGFRSRPATPPLKKFQIELWRMFASMALFAVAFGLWKALATVGGTSGLELVIFIILVIAVGTPFGRGVRAATVVLSGLVLIGFLIVLSVILAFLLHLLGRVL